MKKLLALYPVLLRPWEPPSEEGDHMVSATAGLVFARGKEGPTDGTHQHHHVEGAKMTPH